MSRDYGRSKSTRRSGSGSRQFLQVMMAFITGYLVASVFDFASLTHWINNRLLTQQTSDNTQKKLSTVQEAALPKPKFEFYTLLANGQPAAVSVQPHNKPRVQMQQAAVAAATPMKTPATTSVIAAAQTDAKTITVNRESWVIQVGSFKTMPEAERMKAALILKGYTVQVVSVSQQQGNWFRVLIGPYSSQNEVQQAQVAFSKNERVVGMIRKA